MKMNIANNNRDSLITESGAGVGLPVVVAVLMKSGYFAENLLEIGNRGYGSNLLFALTYSVT